jgi:sugar phosphate isomerase/epimerase
MSRLKVGIELESLGLPLRAALAEAARTGAAGVQLDAVGDLSPSQLSQTGRRELRNLLRTYNLELSAVGCPLRRGLDAAEDQQARIEHVRKVMSLSYDLGPRVVVVQAGAVPQDPSEPRARVLRESLEDLGAHGDRTGTTLALETGLEPGDKLAAYLASFDSGSLAANLDPANLLLGGFDPHESTRALHGRIAHAHARDARRSSASRAAQEVPLGHGDIDWVLFLGTLEEVGYRGWLAVERETGNDRLADVRNGVAFLKRLGAGAPG